MKKVFLVSALFLFLLISPRSVQAGSQCDGLGGSCKTTCLSNEENRGLQDCTPNPRGPSEKCCVAVASSSTQKEENDPTCNGGNGIKTAIGCIPINDTNAFIGFILRWAIGIGGGIAFLLIVYSAFMIMTSRGNPERLKAGQELLTSAIAGLIMLIFSIFILRVIGVDILGLEKFGFGEPIKKTEQPEKGK